MTMSPRKRLILASASLFVASSCIVLLRHGFPHRILTYQAVSNRILSSPLTNVTGIISRNNHGVDGVDTPETRQLSPCKNNLWHMSLEPEDDNTCTNNKDYPLQWESEWVRPHLLLESPERCCESYFGAGHPCDIVDVCDDNVNMGPILGDADDSNASTSNPTGAPIGNPTTSPTRSPTPSPTSNPKSNPTSNPTASPTTTPTKSPSASPQSSNNELDEQSKCGDWHPSISHPLTCTNDKNYPDLWKHRNDVFYNTPVGCCMWYYGVSCTMIDACSDGIQGDAPPADEPDEPNDQNEQKEQTNNPTTSPTKSPSKSPTRAPIQSTCMPTSAPTVGCESNPWHESTLPGVQNTCTNDRNFPEVWYEDGLRDHKLFDNYKSCCKSKFKGVKCDRVDICDEVDGGSGGSTSGGGGPGRFIWHPSHVDPFTCTNANDFPSSWEDRDDLFFQSADECCIEYYDAPCTIVNICDVIQFSDPWISTSPTEAPIEAPSQSPHHKNIYRFPTWIPTFFPTLGPSRIPTYSPTKDPTFEPSQGPSSNPSASPTVSVAPTSSPVASPTTGPSHLPSMSPSARPSISFAPSRWETEEPTKSSSTTSSTVSSDVSSSSGTSATGPTTTSTTTISTSTSSGTSATGSSTTSATTTTTTTSDTTDDVPLASSPCDVLTESIFNMMAPNASLPFTYMGFCNAVDNWNDSNPNNKVFMSGNGETQRYELAAFLGHALHETGDFVHSRSQEMCGDDSAITHNGWVYCLPSTGLPTSAYCNSVLTPTSTPGGCACTAQSGVALPGQSDTYVEANNLFFGRGALQLSWNHNVLAASIALTGSQETFCAYPELISTDALFAWGTAIWIWMTNVGSNGKTCHENIIDNGSFGGSLNIVNGGSGCSADPTVKDRLNRYCKASAILSVPDLLDFDGCWGLESSYDECISDNSCPECSLLITTTTTTTTTTTSTTITITTTTPDTTTSTTTTLLASTTSTASTTNSPAGDFVSADAAFFGFEDDEDSVLASALSYGDPAQWVVDKNVAYSGSQSIKNMPVEGNGSFSSVTLRIDVAATSIIKCYALMHTSMPFDFFSLNVNGKTRNRFHSKSQQWIMIMSGLEAGKNTIEFRVENSNFAPPFSRTSAFGDGTVWLDNVEIYPHK